LKYYPEPADKKSEDINKQFGRLIIFNSGSFQLKFQGNDSTMQFPISFFISNANQELKKFY